MIISIYHDRLTFLLKSHNSRRTGSISWRLILRLPSSLSQKQPRLCFYQTRSAWSVDQGSNKNHSPAYSFAPTVTKFCVMWEGLSLQQDTKFGNGRCKIVDSRAFPSWSLIHGLRWSGLIKAEPGLDYTKYTISCRPAEWVWIGWGKTENKKKFCFSLKWSRT